MWVILRQLDQAMTSMVTDLSLFFTVNFNQLPSMLVFVAPNNVEFYLCFSFPKLCSFVLKFHKFDLNIKIQTKI
jgi:hypothetical protein